MRAAHNVPEMFHVAQITTYSVDYGVLPWYTENMKQKTQPTAKEQKNSKLGSWSGALKYGTIGALTFCAVEGVADAFSRVTEPLWLCIVAVIGMFILLLEYYWLSALLVEKDLEDGTATDLKRMLIIASLAVAVVPGSICFALVLIH